MKRLSLLIFIITVANAMEEKTWKPIDESKITEKNATELRNEAEDRREKAEKAAQKASPSDKVKFERAEKQALYDKAVIEDRIANEWKTESKFQNIGNVRETAQAKQEAVKALTTDMAQTLQQLKNPQFVLQELPAQLETVIAILPSDKPLDRDDINKVTELIGIFSTNVNSQVERLREIQGDEFFDLRDRTVQKIVSMQNEVVRQLETLAKQGKGDSESALVKQLRVLRDKAVSARSEIVNSVVDKYFAQEKEQPGFLARLVQKFMQWWDGVRKNPSTAMDQFYKKIKTDVSFLKKTFFVVNDIIDFSNNLKDYDLREQLILKPNDRRKILSDARAWVDRAKQLQNINLDLPNIQLALKTYQQDQDAYLLRYSSEPTLFEGLYKQYKDALGKSENDILTLDDIMKQQAKEATENNSALLTDLHAAFLRDFKAVQASGIKFSELNVPEVQVQMRNYLKNGSAEKLRINKVDYDFLSPIKPAETSTNLEWLQKSLADRIKAIEDLIQKEEKKKPQSVSQSFSAVPPQ